MPQQFNTFDDFLTHRGSATSSRFLKGWKKDGKLYAFLHTLQFPIGLWSHSFPTLVVREDKTTRKVLRNVWGQSYNCHETEDVLKEQFKRNKDGSREVAPCKCPGCRYWEFIYQEVRSGQLHWCAPVLKVEGADDPRENIVLHAAGTYNGFGNKKLTDEQLDEMKKYGIFQSESWKEDMRAKLGYVFTIVNAVSPGDGVQVTNESKALGDRVKSAINDMIESKGVEAGNPTLNPYCLEFSYNEKEVMDKKYHARAIEKIACTEEIEKLIRSEPPDLSKMLRPFGVEEFRAYLKKHTLIELDFDWIFDIDPPDYGDGEEEEPSVVAEVGVEEEEEVPRAETPARTRKVKEPEIPPEEIGDPCDTCQAPMRKTDAKCGKCGTEYDVEPEEPEPEPEPEPIPEVKKAAASALKTKPCRHCKKPVAKGVNKCPACGKTVIPF